jgi:hypothetical protein
MRQAAREVRGVPKPGVPRAGGGRAARASTGPAGDGRLAKRLKTYHALGYTLAEMQAGYGTESDEATPMQAGDSAGDGCALWEAPSFSIRCGS